MTFYRKMPLGRNLNFFYVYINSGRRFYYYKTSTKKFSFAMHHELSKYRVINLHKYLKLQRILINAN